MVDKASSEPPRFHGSAGIWSERNQKEVQLLAARPSGLPMLEQSPGAEALPVRDGAELGTGVCTGKGRGNQPSVKLACLVTPPSKSMDDGDDAAGYRAKVKQSEGRMPDDGDESRKSTGRVSMDVTIDGVSEPSVDGLVCRKH